MNILILGASGLTGSSVFSVLEEKFNVYGTYFSNSNKHYNSSNWFKLDIEHIEEFESILNQIQPEIIISCLRGDFDKQLELHKKAAEFILDKPNSKLIYLSTINVFDNLTTCPHYEKDQTDSMSDYGKFKIECEKILTNILQEQSVIIRVPFIWGKESPRLKTLIQNIKSGNPVSSYRNLYINHTLDVQIANYIKYIIEKDLTGIFHVGSTDVGDYNEFLIKLINKMNLEMPKFEIEPLGQEGHYMVLLSSRTDIPDDLIMTNNDIIDILTNMNKDDL